MLSTILIDMKIQGILIILLSIISIGLGIYSFQLKQTNDKLLESKNFKSKWSPSQEMLISYWKNNDKLSNQYIDRNFDYNYELINTYTTYGKLCYTSYDLNENGVYEKITNFNIIGEKVGISIDSDEDGEIDEFIINLDNGNELKFIDNDRDGRYEIIHSKNDNKTIELSNEKLFD